MNATTELRVIVPDLVPYIYFNGTALFGPYGVLLASFAVWANVTLKITYQQCRSSSNYAKCRLIGPDGYPSIGDHHDLNMYPAVVKLYNRDLAISPIRNELCLLAPRGSLNYKEFYFFIGSGAMPFLLLFYSIISKFFPRQGQRRSSLLTRLAYTISQSGRLKNVTLREKLVLVLISIFSSHILSQLQNELCATRSTVRYNKDYKTIEQVRVAGLTIMVQETYKVGYSELLRENLERFHFRFYDESEFQFYQSNYAHLLSCYVTNKKVQLDANLDRATNRRIMAVVPTPFHTGYSALRFRPGSLFKRKFEHFYQIFFEVGLMIKLIGGFEPVTKLISPDEFKIVTLFHIHPILELLMFGWLLSMVTIFGELIVRKKLDTIVLDKKRVLLMKHHERSKSEPAILSYKISQIVCPLRTNGYFTD